MTTATTPSTAAQLDRQEETNPNQETAKKIIWSESRSLLGVTINASMLYLNKKIYFEADGSGYGATIGPYRHEVKGDMDWSGVIDRVGDTEVHLHIRINNWKITAGVLTCDLRLWGAYGPGPWLPAGGTHFKVRGRLAGFASATEELEFFGQELGAILEQRGLLGEADPSPVAN